jgi:hypothetical protein
MSASSGEVNMQRYRSGLSMLRGLAGCSAIIWVLLGCSTIGPQSIAAGRAAYNEVINRTEDQQMLKAIVRNRYGDTISMLAVTSVTANSSIPPGQNPIRGSFA